MRAAVCGTHGIGKTTLVESVAQRFQKKPTFGYVLSEAARDVAVQMGYESLADIKYWSPERRNYFQWRVMIEQVAREVEMDLFISDRSVFDNLAYCYYYDCPPEMLEAFSEFCRMHSGQYDVVFYLPIPDQLLMAEVKDGFRLPDFKSLQQVDAIIDDIISGDWLQCTIVKLGTDRDKWLGDVCQYVKRLS